MKRIFLPLIFAVASCSFSNIRAQKAPEWKVDSARGPFKTFEFTATEGTWMNVDVSPDGKEIAFDLLGDIYLMPVTGGKAKAIASGLAWEVQPRFSPDGKKILFTSDRAGGDNIWMMKSDGTEMKQITKESFRLLNNGCWSPDGDFIVAKKHFTGTRSLGAGEMWLFHTSGGSGIQLTKRKNDQQDVGEPCISPDGNFVYFSEDMTAGPVFQYNKNPHEGIYGIRRYDRIKGEVEDITGGAGGACRPQISPDGKILAFVRRVNTKSVLWLHDLATGEEWPIFDGLDKDQQETWATFGVYPNFNFTPDGNSIILCAGGKIKKVNLSSRQAEIIPFEAPVKTIIQDAVKFPQVVSPETFEAKMLRQVRTSPDGKQIVFNAMGKLWVMNKGAKPRRLSANDFNEFEPAFSPDGSQIAFCSWSDAETGAIRIRNSVSGTENKITSEKGYYYNPSFSPDGKWLLYRKGGGSNELGNTFNKENGIYLVNLPGRKPEKISDDGIKPLFSADGQRIYFTAFAGKERLFKSMNLRGEDERTHFKSSYATEFLPSPDGKWLAWRELFNGYVCMFPKTGEAIELSPEMKSIPVFRFSRDAGDYIHWSGDSKQLYWTIGADYFSRELKDCFKFVAGAPDSLPGIDSVGTRIVLEQKTDAPDGMIAIRNARIITMKGDEVIENGTILIEKNRIKSVGAEGTIDVPAKAFLIDAKGKTVMPGIVDVHAHMGNSFNGISPQQQWSYFANLAYGVTTTHDPSSNSEMIFSQSEMIKAGLMTGPRVYSTGTILYGADGDFKAVINSLDDALSNMRRLKSMGAFSVKSYNQPRREQRQMVIEAARRLQMNVVPEGGSFFFHNMTQVADGHTGIEHSIPVYPVYSDVVRFWGASKTSYTPTLIVGYGGIWGENYWYDKTEVWKNDRLLKYYPREILDTRSMRRIKAADEDYGHFGNARACKLIMDGGTKIQLGAHGQLHGLGAHWELWMFVQGGMTPLQAIRSATLSGAEYIGMDKDLGSIETGKLADMIIMDKNPLDDIQHSDDIHRVIMNGRIYDPETMNETGNQVKKRLPFWWEQARGAGNFNWHQENEGFHEHHCGCME